MGIAYSNSTEKSVLRKNTTDIMTPKIIKTIHKQELHGWQSLLTEEGKLRT